jgi:tRNA A37 threonylcarbamoyltransferase TsaD
MINKNLQTILAIETSCDETAAAVIALEKPPRRTPSRPGRPAAVPLFPAIRTLSSVIKSQIKLHKSFGGVVPEVAARAHLKSILPVVKKAVNDSRLTLTDLDYIAVTVGPGLIPSLIVGVEFAKALSLGTGKPLLPVNHLEGHLYSAFGRINSHGQIPGSKKNPKFEIQTQKSLFPRVSIARLPRPGTNCRGTWCTYGGRLQGTRGRSCCCAA